MVRVLVVEDEEKMARAFTRVLREEGYAAETVGDGRTGLARALDASFDLLIVDWMLPGRSGVQIVRGLRAADVHTPVLMLTARPDLGPRRGPRRRGRRLPTQALRPSGASGAREGPDQEAARRGGGADGAGDGGTTIRVGDVALDPVRHEVREGRTGWT